MADKSKSAALPPSQNLSENGGSPLASARPADENPQTAPPTTADLQAASGVLPENGGVEPAVDHDKPFAAFGDRLGQSPPSSHETPDFMPQTTDTPDFMKPTEDWSFADNVPAKYERASAPLAKQFPEWAAELRAIAEESGNADFSIRLNAMANMLDENA